MYVNELGHTILDNLMISILKSHSSAVPGTVDNNWKNVSRFCGEEVDICGRWDADSPCVRHLLGVGHPSTPLSWKHKFCHTSIQTICHCIIRMKDYGVLKLGHSYDSGLYIQHCVHCGQKLELRPLHSLILTTYHLASKGCQEEDLFGMLAVLLCLLSTGFDPLHTANVSVSDLLRIDTMETECNHEELTPAELAQKISSFPSLQVSWSDTARLGWEVFCGILRICQDALMMEWTEEQRGNSDFTDDIEYINENFIVDDKPSDDHIDQHLDGHLYIHCFRRRKDLATLWASVQAELLSYRRLDDSLSWTSRNFSMEELRVQLQRGEPLFVGYAKQNLLRTHCICGEFDRLWGMPALLSDAVNPDIANLDVWDRATYKCVEDETGLPIFD